MKLRSRPIIILLLSLSLSGAVVTASWAQGETPSTSTIPAFSEISTQSLPLTTTDDSWARLEEKVRNDPKLRQLFEEDLQRSFVIRQQIEAEVDRTFSHTTTLLNVLLVVLTAIPILVAFAFWFLRRSVINQLTAEIKKQLQSEVEAQMAEEVARELQEQTETFKADLDALRQEFNAQLQQLQSLFSDAQEEKDAIIAELSQILPSPLRDLANPELQQKIQTLNQQLLRLEADHARLSFTPNDFVEQGRAFYFEGDYDQALSFFERAIQLESSNARAWFSKGITYTKLQQYEQALAAYDRTIEISPDSAEVWFAKGNTLSKLQKHKDAIAAFDQATCLKADFHVAWIAKARSYALVGDPELALEALHQAWEQNPERCFDAIQTDSVFKPFREQPDFQRQQLTQAK